MNSQKVIVRFPPSPTGNLHIGNIRSFLFNYLFAKQNNGDIVFRFEDTDTERSKKEYENVAIRTLQELGLLWDRGPFRQSDRLEFYQDAINTLLNEDRAYEAEESEHGDGKIIRFRNPNKKIKFFDRLRGEIEIDSSTFGDFVIARNKQSPLYHLTVVVDDIDMGVTDVIRGEDHITSTPRQIMLIEALGGIVPNYTHLPLIIGEDKKKLGKRHGAVTWDDFKNQGYLAEGVINYLALLGWHPIDEREIFSLEELIKEFELDRVQTSPAIFSYTKLDDINREWMLKLSIDDYRENAHRFIPEEYYKNDKKWEKIIDLVIHERIKKFSEILDMMDGGEFYYYFNKPQIEKEKLIFKKSDLEETVNLLNKELEFYEKYEGNWDKENLKNLIWDWTSDVGRGQALHPLRMALSGVERSPDPFLLMDILGREESLERIKKAIEILG